MIVHLSYLLHNLFLISLLPHIDKKNQVFLLKRGQFVLVILYQCCSPTLQLGCSCAEHHKPLLLLLLSKLGLSRAPCHFNMFPDIIWGICPQWCPVGTSLPTRRFWMQLQSQLCWLFDPFPSCHPMFFPQQTCLSLSCSIAGCNLHPSHPSLKPFYEVNNIFCNYETKKFKIYISSIFPCNTILFCCRCCKKSLIIYSTAITV